MATNTPPPPASSGGAGEFLKTQIGPFPLWIWMVAGVVVGAFFIVPKLLNRSSANKASAADPTATDAGTAAIDTLAQAGIDPNTGIPFAVEGTTNPMTGLPNYYNGMQFPPGSIGGPPVKQPPTRPPVTNPHPHNPGDPIIPPPPPPGQQNPIGPGGLVFVTPSTETIQQIAESEYGFQIGDPRLNNAIYDILSHNQQEFPNAKYNTPIPQGTRIFIPPVNYQTGWGTTPKTDNPLNNTGPTGPATRPPQAA